MSAAGSVRLAWWGLLAVHLLSFLLPIGSGREPGYEAFWASFQLGVLAGFDPEPHWMLGWSPSFLVLWLANPLFWAGMVAAARSRWAVTTGLAAAGVVAGLLAVPMAADQFRQHGLAAAWQSSGLLAWLACPPALLLLAAGRWWAARGDRRVRFRLGTLMVAVLVAAVLARVGAWYAAIFRAG